MKNNYIANIVTGLCMILALVACTGNSDQKAEHVHAHLYTCPMHPQISQDHPGKCPLCGMDLVLKESNNEMVADSSITRLTRPVNEQVIASVPVIKAETGPHQFTFEVNGIVNYDTRNKVTLSGRVSGRIEKLLIKYNYQPVRKGQLIMEVYSPDLAAAQRELLYIAATSPDMLSRSKERLLLLGMQTAQINQVLSSGKILYRIPVFSSADGYILEQSAVASSSGSLPTASNSGTNTNMNSMQSATITGTGVASNSATQSSPPILLRQGAYINAGQPLFTIYQSKSLVAEFAFTPAMAASIKTGQKLLFFPTGNKEAAQSGSIGLIEPVQRSGENFTLARVYFSNAGLRPGQLITANIPVSFTKGWWLPQKAVHSLGNTSIVFRKKEEVFTPVTVATGAEINGMVQVLTDIGDWEIASNAAYLVDSESFIKPKNN